MHIYISQGNGTEEKGFEKTKVFEADMKELMEAAQWIETGSWFQAAGAVPVAW